MEGLIQDTRELMQRLGLQTVQSVGGIAAGEFLEAIRQPSAEPYWKLPPAVEPARTSSSSPPMPRSRLGQGDDRAR